MAKAKKLPSGSWRVQASATVDGVRIRRSFTDPDRHRAELAAAEWAAGQEKCPASARFTLKEAYERYIAFKENVLSVTTIRGYKTLQRQSLQSIMRVLLNELTSAQIQRAVNEYAVGHSPKGVRNCVGLLTAVLAMFRPEFKPVIRLPQKVKTEMYIPTDNEIAALLDASAGTDLELAVLLGAFGALRLGEVCALTSDDVYDTYIHIHRSMAKDYKGGWIVKSPKTTESDRLVTLPPFVMNKLHGKTGLIVPSNPCVISHQFARTRDRLGLSHFRFHDLRHYNVSSLHALGVPDKYIMAQGGWSTNYTMNNVYNHTVKAREQEFADRAAKHFEEVCHTKCHTND